jgi:hypothetical protein
MNQRLIQLTALGAFSPPYVHTNYMPVETMDLHKMEQSWLREQGPYLIHESLCPSSFHHIQNLTESEADEH